MATRNERHIVPNGGNGWNAINPATGKTTHYPTQTEAERAAKGDLARNGGGEAVIHGLDGRIRDSDTVAPSGDPFPPRDNKH